jgi:hypothetical protein
MKFPKGKGFDLSGGLVLTIVLDDGFTLTGRFLGEAERKLSGNNNCPSPHHGVDNEAEFILLQLTESVITSCKFREVLFPEGSVIAINVDQILFIGPGINCENDDDYKKSHKKKGHKKDHKKDHDYDSDHNDENDDYDHDHEDDCEDGCDCDCDCEDENDRDTNK